MNLKASCCPCFHGNRWNMVLFYWKTLCLLKMKRMWSVTAAAPFLNVVRKLKLNEQWNKQQIWWYFNVAACLCICLIKKQGLRGLRHVYFLLSRVFIVKCDSLNSWTECFQKSLSVWKWVYGYWSLNSLLCGVTQSVSSEMTQVGSQWHVLYLKPMFGVF